MEKIYLVSTNKGKLTEFQKVFLNSRFILLSSDLHLNEYQSNDMEEISRHKALQAFEKLRAPVLVDDSGIYFSKYKNFPGVYSKPIIESLGIQGLTKLIEEGDPAYFQTVISYMDESLSEPKTFIGKYQGILSLRDQSENLESGFPYNHLFVPVGENRFMYQIPVEDRKNQRIIAAEMCLSWLLQNK